MERKYLKALLLTLFSVFKIGSISSQIDSTYIEPFQQDFSARFYTNDKYAGFARDSEDQEMEYRTNNPIGIGVGVSWKNLSFSFSHSFDFFRNRKKGKTESLEFQHHGYARKFVYDVFLQRHQGFYTKGKNAEGSFDIYPNTRLSMCGGILQYVFNNNKFSYQAAFNQNEIQKKSAGSLLLGIALYYSKVHTDSLYLFEGMDVKHKNLQFGASLGYAYSWIFSKQWFLTGSVTAGATIGNNYPSHFFKERIKVYPTVNGKFAIGYNAKDWSVGISYLINQVYLFHTEAESLNMKNQQLQFTIVKRFNWGNKFVNNTLNKTKEKLRL